MGAFAYILGKAAFAPAVLPTHPCLPQRGADLPLVHGRVCSGICLPSPWKRSLDSLWGEYHPLALAGNRVRFNYKIDMMLKVWLSTRSISNTLNAYTVAVCCAAHLRRPRVLADTSHVPGGWRAQGAAAMSSTDRPSSRCTAHYTQTFSLASHRSLVQCGRVVPHA